MNNFFRIRQLGEKQKIKEKSREREKPNVELESKKETKSKIPENIRKRGGESERVPPSQVNLQSSSIFALSSL